MSIQHIRLRKNHANKKRKCKICGITKDWIFSHENCMHKRYKDETGRLWNASVCSECSKKKHNHKNFRKIK